MENNNKCCIYIIKGTNKENINVIKKVVHIHEYHVQAWYQMRVPTSVLAMLQTCVIIIQVLLIVARSS